MKAFLLSSLILSSPLFAAQTFECSGFLNGKLDFIGEVTLAQGQKNQAVGQSSELEFMMSSVQSNNVELQGYNFTEPSRSYSTATLATKGDVVELAIWKREFLVEVKCTLL